MNENEVRNLTQEELEQLENTEEQPLDDRLVELELEKEVIRIEREEKYFDSLPKVKEDNISKEIDRDAQSYANFYSRLVLAGVHGDIAGQLVLNYMTTRHNIEQARLDVEKAKYIGAIQQSQVI